MRIGTVLFCVILYTDIKQKVGYHFTLMEEIKNQENKSFWRKFNPPLKELEERHPNISILELWWAWYWRLAVLVIGVCVIFFVIALVLSLFTK